MSFKPRLKLKDIRVSWVSGELHRNGVTLSEAQVRTSLINKHLHMYGNKGEYAPLSEQEIEDIIYKDPSRYRQKLSPDDIMKVQLKKLDLESKVLDIKLKKEEYKIKNQELLHRKAQAEKLTKELLETSHPSHFNLEMYQRTPVQYCVLAVQSSYPDLSDKQVRLIIGSWVRKGY